MQSGGLVHTEGRKGDLGRTADLVRLLKRVFVSMDLLMKFPVAPLCEALATSFAFKRFLSRVDPSVQLHIPLEPKTLATDVASVRLFARVCHHVAAELGGVVTDHRTVGTLKHLGLV